MTGFHRIVIKIGSNVLTRDDGTLNVDRMKSLVAQVAELRRMGVEVVMVSSGAIASGRSEIRLDHKLDPVASRQLFSAVGQAKLINHYYDLFGEHGLKCGQVLTTKEDFSTRAHYLTQKDCISVLLENGVVPIVNENDTISVTGLMFTDNDELSGLIATMTGADALIILSNIDGIFNGDPANPASRVLERVAPRQSLAKYIQTGKSSFGRGGMLTKCNIARKVAEEGIPVMIANGKREGVLVDLVKGADVPHTLFEPAPKETSGVKKWLAHSESFAKGRVRVNGRASQALSEKACSLLFVGITAVEGDFRKGDIVKVLDAEGNEIGVGKAQFDSERASQLVGRKGQRPFIHYDYLYMV